MKKLVSCLMAGILACGMAFTVSANGPADEAASLPIETRKYNCNTIENRNAWNQGDSMEPAVAAAIFMAYCDDRGVNCVDDAKKNSGSYANSSYGNNIVHDLTSIIFTSNGNHVTPDMRKVWIGINSYNSAGFSLDVNVIGSDTLNALKNNIKRGNPVLISYTDSAGASRYGVATGFYLIKGVSGTITVNDGTGNIININSSQLNSQCITMPVKTVTVGESAVINTTRRYNCDTAANRAIWGKTGPSSAAVAAAISLTHLEDYVPDTSIPASVLNGVSPYDNTQGYALTTELLAYIPTETNPSQIQAGIKSYMISKGMSSYVFPTAYYVGCSASVDEMKTTLKAGRPAMVRITDPNDPSNANFWAVATYFSQENESHLVVKVNTGNGSLYPIPIDGSQITACITFGFQYP